MAVPDFLLPRELSDRAANADAEALDALSRTNPTLHVTVIQNVVMLLLLYTAGIEIGSWMNPRTLLSEWLIDPARGKPRRSGRGRIARTAQPSFGI